MGRTCVNVVALDSSNNRASCIFAVNVNQEGMLLLPGGGGTQGVYCTDMPLGNMKMEPSIYQIRPKLDTCIYLRSKLMSAA